jgi:hypothetical protein
MDNTVISPNPIATQYVDSSPQASKSSSKTLLYILFVLMFVVILGLGGALAYFLFFKESADTSDGGNGDGDGIVSICTYDSVVYYEGDTFPATDGCNTCSCTSGEVVCTEMACDDEESGAYTGWLTLNNDVGYSIRYPSTLDVVTLPESELGDSINPEVASYVVFRPLSDLQTGTTTFLSIAYQDHNEVSDIHYQLVSFDSAEEFAQIVLETNQSNPYAYVSTEQDVHQVEFAGRTAYKFTIVSSGFAGPYESAASSEGTISAIFWKENSDYFCVAYYEIEPYTTMIESFTF